MLELVNFSNYKEDNIRFFDNNAENLCDFLELNNLDGIEMFFCDKWEKDVHKKEFIKGVHLPFYSNWLDFWYGNEDKVLKDYETKNTIAKTYNGFTKKGMLQPFADNIALAVDAGAEYVVFHVSNARRDEVVNFNFRYGDKEVMTAFIEFFNKLLKYIPEDMTVLFENLWWPGLTLLDKNLTGIFLDNIKHENKGIMLDTGHLLSTNLDLKNQDEAVTYILNTVENLGEYKKYIKGIHLHYSLSGDYIRQVQKENPFFKKEFEIISHILKIDRHLPFETKRVKEIVEMIQPEFLVHEIVQITKEDWQEKLSIQKEALR
ncbi:sugar phosphate isomerase/epimerase [Selenomonadales bacterium OttesenSCG-928-I06]|nr:sugar phosphate isomerase/epimerase [Selenomonadales bacterium OttesenSCG-928-I06]